MNMDVVVLLMYALNGSAVRHKKIQNLDCQIMTMTMTNIYFT